LGPEQPADDVTVCFVGSGGVLLSRRRRWVQNSFWRQNILAKFYLVEIIIAKFYLTKIILANFYFVRFVLATFNFLEIILVIFWGAEIILAKCYFWMLLYKILFGVLYFSKI
jgi:hypothetical protein